MAQPNFRIVEHLHGSAGGDDDGVAFVLFASGLPHRQSGALAGSLRRLDVLAITLRISDGAKENGIALRLRKAFELRLRVGRASSVSPRLILGGSGPALAGGEGN